tara:strand:- start:2411 stop:3400 length:990 start_codon:yes stop_codon:yes gene_type:complete
MALEKIDLKLYVYSGTSGSYSSSDLKYQISKERISSQNNIVLEIGELVKDYLLSSFNNDYLCSTKWATAVVEYYDSETGAIYESNGTQILTYIAFDGYGDFEEEINPTLSTDLLQTSLNMYLPEDTAGKLAIFAEGVGKVIIDSTTTQITDSGNSNQKIQYLTIPANSSTVKVYGTDDSTLLKTVTVNNVCETKYTPKKVSYINKLGAIQDVYFFLKTNESFNVTDDTYKRNIINTSSLTYGTNDGQKQRYNVNGSTKITLNTGYVKENFNSALEELFLSENAWIRWDGKTLPVIITSKNMAFKTSLNDKLINYTVGFEFAFNKINNVR